MRAGSADTTTTGTTFRFRRTEALARLASSQKSAASIPAYLRFVNRKAGGQLAALSYALGLTPTQVTLLSSLFSFAGILLLAVREASLAVGISVALLLASGYALDSADGQLARVQGGGTRAGEWLDHVADIAKLCALHGAVLLSGLLHESDPSRGWLVVPLVFLVAQVTMFFGLMLRDQLAARSNTPGSVRDTNTSIVKSLAMLPMDYGMLCWIFVLLSVPTAFRIGYTLLAAYTCIFAVRSLMRAYRAVSELDTAQRPA